MAPPSFANPIHDYLGRAREFAIFCAARQQNRYSRRFQCLYIPDGTGAQACCGVHVCLCAASLVKCRAGVKMIQLFPGFLAIRKVA
jgi:hypothetical protein